MRVSARAVDAAGNVSACSIASLAYTHRDWPGDYVRIDLQRATMLWASRRPMGLTALPASSLALDDRDRLAWLLGRVEVAGLDPAGIT